MCFSLCGVNFLYCWRQFIMWLFPVHFLKWIELRHVFPAIMYHEIKEDSTASMHWFIKAAFWTTFFALSTLIVVQLDVWGFCWGTKYGISRSNYRHGCLIFGNGNLPKTDSGDDLSKISQRPPLWHCDGCVKSYARQISYVLHFNDRFPPLDCTWMRPIDFWNSLVEHQQVAQIQIHDR